MWKVFPFQEMSSDQLNKLKLSIVDAIVLIMYHGDCEEISCQLYLNLLSYFLAKESEGYYDGVGSGSAINYLIKKAEEKFGEVDQAKSMKGNN